jgi:hypothetical protein
MKPILKIRIALLLVSFLLFGGLRAQSSLSLRVQPGLSFVESLREISPLAGRAGFSFRQQIVKRLDFSISPGYYLVSGDDHETEVSIGQGAYVRNSWYKTRMHFVDIEGELGYWAGKRVRLSLGVYFAYLLQFRDKYHTIFTTGSYNEETFSNQDRTQFTTRSVIGLRPSVLVNLAPSWDLRLTYSQGLKPMEMDLYNGVYVVELQPRALMLGVDWKLVRFGGPRHMRTPGAADGM